MRHKECVDHKGHKFRTVLAMCKYWKVEPTTFQYRIKCGKSLEFALTAPSYSNYTVPKKGIVKDHEGNEFYSVKEMLEHWGIEYSSLYYNRKRNGWTLEECLTGIRKRKVV